VSALSTPSQVQIRLEAIEDDLARRQNDLEDAALEWFRAKRDREIEELRAYTEAVGTAPHRKFAADAAGAVIGADEEASWEGKKAVVRVLETRANIGMAILKSHGRA
jgi:hypothetical protein